MSYELNTEVFYSFFKSFLKSHLWLEPQQVFCLCDICEGVFYVPLSLGGKFRLNVFFKYLIYVFDDV